MRTQHLQSVLVEARGHPLGRRVCSLLEGHYRPIVGASESAESDTVARVFVAEDAEIALSSVRDAGDSALPILVVAEAADPQEYLGLLRAGASDFLCPPLDAVELRTRLERITRPRSSDAEVAQLKERLGLHQLIGESPAFCSVVHDIPTIAGSDATVLVRGETGTGKEVCARAIHYLSRRSDGPFVPVNCGAIPAELVENELFGHDPSAFTGAGNAVDGLVSEAEGGTFFLDEIDSLPPGVQVKLLRLLQERTYRRLGSSRTRSADIRFIAASNADLASFVREGRFRSDLYYRLDVLSIALPPLRERTDDVLLLAEHFLTKHAREHRRPRPTLDPSAAHCLATHEWPGNVRELENVIERAVVLASGTATIGAADLRLSNQADRKWATFREAKARVVERFEVGYLEQILRAHGGNVASAARAAGKDPRALRELMRKYSVDANRYRRAKAQ